MLDMVYAKSMVINELYDSTLVEPELQPLGEDLRAQLATTSIPCSRSLTSTRY